MIIVIVLVVLSLCVIWGVTTSNKFNRYEISIEESRKTVDIALTKRYDIITEMAKVAKSYAKHEEEVMFHLSDTRRQSLEGTNEVIKNQETAINKLMAVGEAYPQLYSNELYKNLQNQIAEQNEYLSASKRTVNSNISVYNQLLVSFPSSAIGSMKGKSKLDFLMEENLEKKRNVELDLDI